MFIIKSQDRYINITNGWIKKEDNEEDASLFESKADTKPIIDKMKGFGYSDIRIEEIRK